MSMTLTCKCGMKFSVDLEQVGKEVLCPTCGRKAKVPEPKSRPVPAAPPPVEEEEEIKLQDLEYPEPKPTEEVRSQEIAHPLAQEVIEDNDGVGYGLDDKDGLSNLDVGTGMYGTIAVVNLDELAPCIAYGSKGDWALAGQGSDVLILNVKSKKKAAFFEEHDAPITAVAMSATEPLALSGDEDGELRYWSLASRKSKKKIRAHKDAINAVALSPDGQWAVTGGEDGCIRLWNLTTGKRRDLEHADWGDEWDEMITYVSFSRDGSKILAGGDDGHVSVWDAESGIRLRRFPCLDMPISCVRLSDEGGRVTATTEPVAERDRSFLIICHWETKTGKPIKQFNLAVESIPCCIAPDRGGTRVIIAGGGSEPWMGVFSLESGRCLHAYEELRGTPLSLAVAPLNNRLLATLENDRLQLFGLEPH